MARCTKPRPDAFAPLLKTRRSGEVAMLLSLESCADSLPRLTFRAASGRRPFRRSERSPKRLRFHSPTRIVLCIATRIIFIVGRRGRRSPGLCVCSMCSTLILPATCSSVSVTPGSGSPLAAKTGIFEKGSASEHAPLVCRRR